MLISFLFFVLAGLCKALLDEQSDLDKYFTWKKKWKLDSKSNPIITRNRCYHWWYFGLYKPNFIESFPYSSIVLVLFTDKWHLYQFLFLRTTFIAICLFLEVKFLYMLLYSFIIFPRLIGIPFEIFYRIFKRN